MRIKIPVSWEVVATITVDVDTPSDLMLEVDRLYESSELPDGDYLSDSFAVDMARVTISGMECPRCESVSFRLDEYWLRQGDQRCKCADCGLLVNPFAEE